VKNLVFQAATTSTRSNPGSLLSLKSEQISGISELQGKKVAVVEGTTTIESLKQALKEAVSDAQVVPVASALTAWLLWKQAR
jgi:ABC-type nitrate/sulfonate/bicarbonate transport system substrate-binding protein